MTASSGGERWREKTSIGPSLTHASIMRHLLAEHVPYLAAAQTQFLDIVQHRVDDLNPQHVHWAIKDVPLLVHLGARGGGGGGGGGEGGGGGREEDEGCGRHLKIVKNTQSQRLLRSKAMFHGHT